MTEAPPRRGRHILLLDDDHDFADSLADLLQLEGYRVTVVYRHDDALAAVATERPEVVLIDLRLDAASGISVVRQLHAEYPDIPPVIITAYASLETSVEAMHAGAYDYLRKPVHSTELLAALERCFERRRLAAERRAALAQLAQSEERLRRLIEHSPSAIGFEDLDGRMLLLNERFRQLFPAGGTTIATPAEDATVQAGGTIGREIEIGPNEDVRRVLVTRFPVFGESARPIGVGTIATDVTERRRTEERLRQAQRLEALGRLTGGVAHDFNNLLAVVLGNLRLLEQELEARSELLEMVREGIEATLSGSELTGRLLAIGQSQELKPEVTDLGEVLSDMVRMLRRVLDERVEIEFTLGPQLWDVRIDRSRLEGCLLNLAINSRDAMPEGGRLILAAFNTVLEAEANTSARTERNFVELTVRDTGVGMPPEIRERALQPFFTTKPSGQGSGLGLSIVHGFVAQSGGQLEIASLVGGGTTVTLRLPRCIEEVDRVQTAPPAAHLQAANGEHILVVEDQIAIRRWLSRQLRRVGYAVYEASDAKAAVRALTHLDRVDLVLTDIVLPGEGSGLAVCHAARRRRPAPALVLMTGYAAEILQGIDAELASAPVLYKPIEPEMLLHTLRAALAQPGGART
ncbi:MAG: response regulator [Acetobacteraceae bacterium]